MQADFYSLFSLNDLREDAEAVASALLQSCTRTTPRRPIALCQMGDQVLIVLRPADEPPEDLRFLPLTLPEPDTLRAILQDRWMGGYEPVGMVTDFADDGTRLAFLLVQKVHP